jgi:hypothetical protein
MENKDCPNIVKCPLYAHLLLESTKDSIVGLYCKGDYEKCERKKLKDSGQTVPEKLMPNGKYLH